MNPLFADDRERSEARAQLKRQVESCVHRGEVTLASGRVTDFYFDGRLVTLDPSGLKLLSRLAVEIIGERCQAVGGPTSGADPMVAGIGLEALAAGQQLHTFFVRKEKKGHGMQKGIEGPALPDGVQVAIVDDTATTGGSLIRAAQAVRDETGAQPVLALVLVDREEGAREMVEAAGMEFIPLFVRSELG